MKLLREAIRRLILESACDQTNNKIYHAITELQFHKLTVEWQKDNRTLAVEIKTQDGNKVAYLGASTSSDYSCNDAFIIGYTEVENPYRGNAGFGALIYDIAIELAGKRGLASDRSVVSGDAVGMWEYFFSSDDYDKKPLDNEDGEFTPSDPTDDCEADSYLRHGGYWDDDKEEFQSHPLNNVYYKKDQSQPTIACVKEMGLVNKRRASSPWPKKKYIQP